MKTSILLGLAAGATAFVIPDQETLNSLAIEPQQEEVHPFWDNVKQDASRIWEDLEKQFDEAAESAKQLFDDAVDFTYDTTVEYGDKFETAFAGQSWLDSATTEDDTAERPPHHGKPPHHGPPGHRRPHHPPHHGPPNQTVYELIAKSKYTTKLAAAIDEFPDLVKLLNGTSANFTVFAPTDRAFEKIPKHAPKPPKEFLKKLLTYHVSPEFYPAGRVLVTRTIPSALENPKFGKKNPQRLATEIGLRGLTVNFYSRIIAINIFGTNGVIHGLDSILLPPPKVARIIDALPGEFSTLELALVKTGIYERFNDTEKHGAGTLFAPSNFAFQKLGPRINAFLFSSYGLKYLKALILYHIVPDVVLYSDAIYKVDSKDSTDMAFEGPHHGPPKGFFHVDLPTALDDKSLSIDIARYGRLIEIKINGFNRVAVSDGVAYDGVIHVVPNVLIPPKTPGGEASVAEEMELEEFLQRMAPLAGDVDVDVNDLEL
jgi:uncharacterized surface protein with fasciclin (FAS1) repeats